MYGPPNVQFAAHIGLYTPCDVTYNDDDKVTGKALHLHIPETVANLCFGDQQRNRLYICGSTSLYAVYTSVQGAIHLGKTHGRPRPLPGARLRGAIGPRHPAHAS